MKKLIIPFFAIALITGFSHTILAQVPTSGLRLHLKADAGTSTTVSGQKVSTWSDQSGNGFQAIENNTTWQPTYIVENGISMLRFNSAAPTSMNLPKPSDMGFYDTDYEMFVVTRSSSQSVQFVVAGGINYNEIQLNGASGVRFIPILGNPVDNTNRADDGEFHIINSKGTTTEATLGIDGNYVSNSIDATTTIDVAFNLGTRSDGNYRLDGDIAEIIIYNRKLTGTESMQVSEYLKNKYATDFTAYAAPGTSASSLGFSSVTQNSITFSLTEGQGSHRIIVARKGGAVNAAPVDGVEYTGNASFGSGSQIGTGNYVVYAGTEGASTAISNLAFNSSYHFAVYEYNYVSGSTAYGVATTANQTTSDLIQASNVQVGSITDNTFSGGVTAGSGTHRLVVAREGGAVNQGPVDGVSYSGNSGYGSGSQIGTGNYVIYNGAEGSTFAMTNMSANTVYHIAVFEYVFVDGVPKYRTSNPAVVSEITAPSTASSEIQYSGISNSGMTISLTPGNGQKRLVIARANNMVNTAPQNGESYTANSTFGSGTQLGIGNFVVYNGSGSSFTMSGLTQNTIYHLIVYEYNEYGGLSRFQTISPLTSSDITAPGTAASGVQYSAISNSGMTISLTPGNGQKRLVLARASTEVNAVPQNGGSYAANSNFGSGTELGSGNFVVYSGSGSSFNISGLTQNTIYHLVVYEYNEYGGLSRFQTISPITSSDMTAPGTAASGVGISGVDFTEMTISLTPGSGQKRLVLARASTEVNAVPQNGGSYVANSTFGSGTELGSGNFVVYNGSGSSVTISGLDNSTIYNYAIYEYNEFEGVSRFQTISPLTASQSTTVVPFPSITNVGISNLTSTSADITSSVNPEGYESTVKLVYGTSPSNLENETSIQNIGAGSENITVPFELSDLNTGEIYYAKIIANNLRGDTESVLLTILPFPKNHLRGWYRGDNVNLVSTRISQFNDLSGFNNYSSLTAGTVLYNPVGINGLPSFSLTSSAFYLNPYSMGILNTNLEMFIVFKSSNGAQQKMLGNIKPPYDTNLILSLNKNSSGIEVIMNGSESAIYSGSALDYTDGSGHVLHYKATSENIQLRMDDEEQQEVSGNGRIVLAGDDYLLFQNFSQSTMEIAEILFFNSILPRSQYAEIAEYLSNRYGISVYIPEIPDQPASDIEFTNVGNSNFDVSFTKGNGDRRIIVARSSGSSKTPPSNNALYSANSNFGDGSDLGNNNYVVYDGTGNTVSVTGLQPNSEYVVDVYEYSIIDGEAEYLLSSPNSASQTTNALSYPTVQSSNPFVTQVSTTSMNIGLTKGDGAKRVVLAKKGEGVNALPVDGQIYTSNATFGSGSEIGAGNFIVYIGSDSSFTVTGLESGERYHYSVFEFNELIETRYLINNPLIFSKNTITNIPTGESGSSIVFGGSDENVRVSHKSEFNSSAITMELWFKSDDSGTDYDFLTSKDVEELEIHLGAQGVANTIRFIPANQVYIDSPVGVFNVGEWTHLAVVYDPSQALAKMYVNGNEVQVTNNGSNPLTTPRKQTTSAFYLGSRGGSALFYNGSMDEVRLWNTVRTADEIREFMHRPVTSGFHDMIAYWQFNEDTGTSLEDIISGLDGTLENFEFSASNGWEDSEITFGSGSFTSVDGVTTGTHALSNLSISLTEDFDNAVTLTSNYINSAPNVTPEVDLTLEGAYWIIDAVGFPGTFESTLTFTVPSSMTSKGQPANSQFKLYHRSANGTGNWTEVASTASSFTSNTISFETISELGQFTIGRDINIEYTQGPGSAIKFDGTNDYISVPDNDAFVVSRYTLELWFKISSDSPNIAFLTSKSSEEFEIHTITSTKSMRFIPATGVYIDAPVNSYELDTWTHLALIYDPSQSLAKMYFNGVEATHTEAGNLSSVLGNSSGSFNIGRRYEGSFPFKGELDEIRLWNTIRTPSQIQQDMNKPTSSGYAPGLVAYWQFNEGTGTNTAEATSNLSGTLNNFDFNAASGWLSSRAPVEDRVRVQTSLTGTEGWRLLATPVADSSLSSLLSNIWTQGFNGAKVTNGSPNVFTWSVENGSNGSSNWSPLTDISNSPSNGAGALVYVFSDDDGPGVGGDAGFPKLIGTGGLEPTEDRNLNAVLNTNANGWTLIGNPFKKDVDWDQFSKTNLSDVVYTYDNSASSWKEWSDGAGDLTNGEIGAFNAFFVQTTGENPSLTVPRSARLDSARKFLGKSNLERGIYTLSLSVENEAGFQDKVWFRISDEGDLGIDNKDGYNLVPLSPDYLMLGALLNDGTDLSINNLPVLDDLYEFPLSVSTTNSGEHQVSVGELSLPEGWTIQLTDKETGKTSDLSEPYIFNMNANVEKAKISALAAPAIGAVSKKKGESRFVISISPKGEEGFETTPDVFALDQNYPNPFNPSTMIRYQLPVSSEVSLKVFDILGREVAELINGRIEAGHHQIQFNARDLASGMYLYRLQAGDQVFTKKLTLIK